CGVSARADVGENPFDRLLDRRIGGQLDRVQMREDLLEVGRARIEAAHRTHVVASTAASSLSMSGISSARLSLSAAALTIRREEIATFPSTRTSRFERKVLPVETRSTIASASPAKGASSIEP